MPKLYSVEVKFEFYVVADSAEEAENIAEFDGDFTCSDWVDALEVTDIDRVPSDWRNSIPYGDKSLVQDDTVEQILNRIKEASETAKETRKRLEDAGQLPLI